MQWEWNWTDRWNVSWILMNVTLLRNCECEWMRSQSNLIFLSEPEWQWIYIIEWMNESERILIMYLWFWWWFWFWLIDLIDWLIDWSIDWLIDLIDWFDLIWFIDWLIGLIGFIDLIDWLIDWWIDWLIDWVMVSDNLSCLSVCHSHNVWFYELSWVNPRLSLDMTMGPVVLQTRYLPSLARPVQEASKGARSLEKWSLGLNLAVRELAMTDDHETINYKQW